MTREKEIRAMAEYAAEKEFDFPPHEDYESVGDLFEACARNIEYGAKWADEHPISQWVKCSERLPDGNKDTFDGYLVRTTAHTRSQGKNTVYTAVYFEGKFEIIGDECATQKITHWMPIPKFEEE